MKFQNIQRFMWVNYNGEPWCVTMFHGTTIELISAYSKEIAFAQSFELEPLQGLPQFKVGDSVICTAKNSPLYQKVVTVSYVLTDSYDGHQITYDESDEKHNDWVSDWVTPYQIAPISY